MSPNRLRCLSIASLALAAALACGTARAAAPDPETPDYLVPDAPSAAIETHRATDGRLQIEIEGRHFDGRRLTKRVLAAIRHEPLAGADFDLHIAVGALAGFNGEVLYDVDLRLAQRAGRIGGFALTGSTPDKSKVHGDVLNGRTLFLTADDAGAFLRFVDLYGKLAGGNMWVALELPALQDGILTIRDFDLPNEPVLQKLQTLVSRPALQSQDAPAMSSRLRAEFSLLPDKVVVKDTTFVDKDVTVTMEGLIASGELNLRGILVPAALYGPQGPPCTPHLCAGGMPYRVTGPVGAATLLINPFPGPHLRSVLPR
jgi:hypothetical protein